MKMSKRIALMLAILMTLSLAFSACSRLPIGDNTESGTDSAAVETTGGETTKTPEDQTTEVITTAEVTESSNSETVTTEKQGGEVTTETKTDAPEKTEPEDEKPKETEPEKTDPEEENPKETEPEETQPEETQPEETQPQETESKETEPQMTEPDESETTEAVTETDTETEPETDTDTETDADTETETECIDHDWSMFVDNGEDHYTYCLNCGEREYGDHVENFEYSFDGESHWIACIDCGARLEFEEHTKRTVKVDDNEHRVVCEICENELVVTEHDFKVVEQRVSHECECGAVQDCPALDTGYKYNDRQHWKTACKLCGVQNEKQDHDWFYLPKQRTCSDCGYCQTCDDDHMVFDAEGHWRGESCEICRCDIDEEKILHEGSVIRKIVGKTHTVYKQTCEDCMYTYASWEVSNEVNYFSVPGQYMNNWNCDTDSNGGYGKVGAIMSDEDKPYARITLYGGASFNFASETFVKGFAADEPIRGGSGKYAVIKMRAHAVGFISLALNSNKSEFADSNFNPGVSPHRNDRAAGNIVHDTWVTYVIDLELLNCAQYPVGDPEVTDISVGLFFNGHTADGTAYVDIEYFAICDTWDEIESVVGEGRKIFYTSWKSVSNDSVRISDGSFSEACVGECRPGLIISGDTYTYKCLSCGEVIETRTVRVGQDGINYYSAPSSTQVYNSWNTGMLTSGKGYVADLRIYEDSFVYNRITLQNGGSFEFTNGTATVNKGFGTVDDTIYGAGQFMVIKMRVGVGESFLRLLAWDGRTPDRGGDAIFDAWDGSPSTSRVMTDADRDWVVYVIEIAALFAQSDYAAQDSQMTKATFGIKGDSSGGSYQNRAWVDLDTTDYIDVAYFAICDDWQEVAAVTAGEETVVFTAWSDVVGYDEIRKPDGTVLKKQLNE